MSQVRIIYLKEVTLRGGAVRAPRDVEIVPHVTAQILVSRGSACYYSDFKEEMIGSGDAGEGEVRTVTPESNAALVTDAPEGGESGDAGEGQPIDGEEIGES